MLKKLATVSAILVCTVTAPASSASDMNSLLPFVKLENPTSDEIRKAVATMTFAERQSLSDNLRMIEAALGQAEEAKSAEYPSKDTPSQTIKAKCEKDLQATRAELEALKAKLKTR